MFKNYEEKRENLFNQANELLDTEGNSENYKNILNQINELDEQYEAYRNEKANLEALNNTQKPVINFMDIKAKNGGLNVTDGNNVCDSLEYRKAFMNYVLKGTPIPGEFKNNAGEVTKTTDIGEVIPETVLNKIIEKMNDSGMILPLVTRTAYKGGLSIPTSNIKPVATWVNEGEGSPTQKKTTSSIMFGYHKLRCAVSRTLETDVMALSAFEAALINNVYEAMLMAVEQAIIHGTGEGQPTGILTGEIADDKTIILTDGKLSYQTLLDAESHLDLSYEDGAVWFMNKATFLAFVGMLDANGQPIARVDHGITGKPERVLLGRKVILTEYLPNINSSEADKVIAFLFNPKDYILNTNLGLTVKNYENNETDDLVTKAIMVVDGKVVDNNSLVVLKKS